MDSRWKRLLILFGVLLVLFVVSLGLSVFFSNVALGAPAEKIGAFEFGFSASQLDELGDETGVSYGEKMGFLLERLTVYRTGDAFKAPIVSRENVAIRSRQEGNETFWVFVVPKGVVGENYSVFIDLDTFDDFAFDLPVLRESDLA